MVENELTRVVKALMAGRTPSGFARDCGVPRQRIYDLFKDGSTSDDTLRAISRATGCPYRTLLLAAHPEEEASS